MLMIRFYSLFVTDDTLLASPYIRRFNLLYDLILHRGQSEIVNFLLQTDLTPKQIENLSIVYDPLTIDLQKVDVQPYKHQTLLTVKLVPKELGSVRIGFSHPQTSAIKSKSRKTSSPFTAVLCSSLQTS